MMHDKAKQEPKTCVWWDINTCPVPEGYDAGMVCERIVSALNHTGYTGPVTSITAFGHLSHTLNRTPDVLPAIYSSGIHLHHTNRDSYIGCESDLWTRGNQPPATIVLISGADAYDAHVSLIFSDLESMGYTTLLVHPEQADFSVVSRARRSRGDKRTCT